LNALNYVLFQKKFGRRTTPSEGEQAFDHYQSFRFASRFNSSHRKVFDPTKKSLAAAAYADMWAAVYSHLVTTRQGDPSLLRDALFCCESILSDQGYVSRVALRDVVPTKPDSRIAMLVPGCQTRKILRNRAVVGADVYHRFTFKEGLPTFCLLSGARPSKSGRVRIRDESRILHKHFVEHLALCQNKHVQDLDNETSLIARDIVVDAKASLTAANVRNFVSTLRDQFTRAARSRPQMIVVVSSTFHLIKLAPALEEGLRGLRSEDLALPPSLDLLLVGAENVNGIESPSTSPIVWDPSYSKYMFFEIFNYLAKRGLLPRYGD
jgi:hypothetical protein